MTQLKQKIQPSHSRGSLVQSPDLPIIQQGENDMFSAILLHKKLKVQSIFANWIKRRIEKYGFEIGKDFFPTLERSSGGRKATDYLLTLDMCKELSMLEENEIGRAIRRAFIEAEKKARGISQLPKEPALFTGFKATHINGRKMYPYKQVRIKCGYSVKGSSANHRNRYPQHFVLQGHLLLTTEDFCLHLYHQKQVVNNRAALKAMQPVLPFNFAEPLKLNPHGSIQN